MILETNDKLAFALASERVAFTYETQDRVIGSMTVGSRTVPVSLGLPDQQYHLEMHLPFCIKGDVAWEAYEHLAERPEPGFRFWMDPNDGETKYCDALCEATTAELDRALDRAASCLEAELDTLSMFHDLSESRENSPKDSGSQGKKSLLDLLRSSMMEDD